MNVPLLILTLKKEIKTVIAEKNRRFGKPDESFLETAVWKFRSNKLLVKISITRAFFGFLL